MAVVEDTRPDRKSLEEVHGSIDVPPTGGSDAKAAPAVHVPRTGLPGQRRLHGPGQLGDGPGGGRAVRLRADLGPADVEPDGRAAPDPGGAAGGGDGARPRPGLSRRVFAGSQRDPLDPGRGGDRGDRPGRDPGDDHRAEAPLRPAPALGLPDHGVRYLRALCTCSVGGCGRWRPSSSSSWRRSAAASWSRSSRPSPRWRGCSRGCGPACPRVPCSWRSGSSGPR